MNALYGRLGAARCTWVLLVSASGLCACGGGDGANPAPPAADFSVSLSTSSLSAQVGSSTSPLVIAITRTHGFSGTVSVAIQGVPDGVTVLPSSTFSLAPGASQSVTFSPSDTAPVGPASITVLASNGGQYSSAQFVLTAESIVRTYQSGSRLYIESGTAADVARVGLETTWGGSIVELSVNGTEYVNRHDTGREVQPAFRSSTDSNWNPTLGGDSYDRGTPLIEQLVTADSIYIKAQPLQWTPDPFGGGPGQVIAGDMLVEQTVTAVTSSPHTFKVHYKVTHLGSDSHGSDSGQEFLAVYTNRDYATFVSYQGQAPWSNDTLTTAQFPLLGMPNPPVAVTEPWGALVDSGGMGLTVYAPDSGPIYIGFIAADPSSAGGPADNATNYFASMANWTIGPGFVTKADFYLVGGDFHAARSIVYRLHKTQTAADAAAP
jgi:hypothetical protein